MLTSVTNRSLLFGLTTLLLGLNILVYVLVFSRNTDSLRVSFLNVGQGDAILIESPSGVDVLIDGGRDRAVLRELGKRLGPFDRSISLVVETHPDADHIGGLPHVFERYVVSHFLTSSVTHETDMTAALTAAIEKEGIAPLPALRGTRIDLGKGAYLDVLFPDREVSAIESNTGSVVLKLSYGSTSFLLTGDAPESIENWLVTLDGEYLQSQVLKAGHHGSRTSTGQRFIETVNPKTVVISAGKNNSYGHPHEGVLQRIAEAGAETKNTFSGTVVFESDGQALSIK